MATSTSKLHTNHRRIRFYVSSVVSIGLAILILWGLVTNFDPKATVKDFRIISVDEDNWRLDISVELTNRNYFRGFNYTGGYFQVWQLSNNDSFYFGYNNTGLTRYQGVRNTSEWNVTIWSDPSSIAKNQDSRFYACLYFVYRTKILSWTTNTVLYQWLDTNMYLGDNWRLKNEAPLNRLTNFTLALGYGYEYKAQ